MERPILFNSEMVRALLEGRKTCTRRIIKNKYENADIEYFENKHGKRLIYKQNDIPGPVKNSDGTTTHKLIAMEEIKKPYEIGDILWVRETWTAHSKGPNTLAVKYKADGEINECVKFTKDRFENFYKFADQEKWQPSLFMPREAARLFLKIKNIKAERLQEITSEQILQEGTNVVKSGYSRDDYEFCWINLWNSTATKDEYRWNENPWVWVIEFEKITLHNKTNKTSN